MKRIKILIIIAISVIGALFIYNYFLKHPQHKNGGKKVTEEYNLIENSVMIYKSIDEINQIISKGNGIIFLCVKENEWCKYYAEYLNDVVSKNGINEINYLDIKQDRAYNTSGYRKLVNNLEDYLLKDDENSLRVFVPTIIFVKNGKIIGYDNKVSLILQNINPEEYWTEERINEFEIEMIQYISDYKEEE